MSTRVYRDGTLALTAGSEVITGTGTLFVANVAIGDVLILSSGKVIEILSVDDDTHLKADTVQTVTESGTTYVALRFVTAAQYRDLTMKIEQFLVDRSTSLTEFTAWVNGIPTGGPNGDGKYPLTDRFGVVKMCRCPALLDGVADSILDEFADLKAQVQALADNPSGYTLPKATKLILGGVKVGNSLSVDADGVINLPNGGAANWGTTRNYTSTVSQGAMSMEVMNVLLQPAFDTTAIVSGTRIEVLYNSNRNYGVGGYPMADHAIFNANGQASIDKCVVRLAQLNLSCGPVAAALCYEGVISTIGQGTMIDGAVGFFWPNMRGVANINNIRRLGAFVNQDTESEVQSYGPFLNADLVELAPPAHPGLVAGRHYSCPYETLGTATINPGLIFLSMVHIPHRVTIKKLGFNLVQNGGAAGHAQIAMYQAKNGQPARRVGTTGEVDIGGANGLRNTDVNFRVDPGMYFLAITTSVDIGITWSNESVGYLANLYGQADPLAQGGALQAAGYVDGFAYATLPAELGPIKYVNTHTRPHLWFCP